MKTCRHCGVIDLHEYEQKELALIKSMVPVTSSELAKRCKIALNNASNRLRKWERAGFLVRDAANDPTGGLIYIYLIKKERPNGE